jgi:hypothetical protein
LAAVPNTPRAIEISVFVVRAFVRLREILSTHKALANRLAELKSQMETQDEAIRSLENISWVRFGAGKCIRDWVTRMTDQQEDLMKALGAEQYLHSAQKA